MRYKYDKESSKRYTTVAFIEEESDWTAKLAIEQQDPAQFDQRQLGVRIDYWETDLREKVKAAGGIWRRKQKLWEMRYKDVVALGLEARVVADEQ